jgi:hypothetical protein
LFLPAPFDEKKIFPFLLPLIQQSRKKPLLTGKQTIYKNGEKADPTSALPITKFKPKSMIPKKHHLLAALLLTGGLQTFAQKETGARSTTITLREKSLGSSTDANSEGSESRNFTFVKLNLAGLAVKNYSLQVERTLNKKFSAIVGFRIMPNTALPFRSQINNSIGDNSVNTKDIVNNLELSNIAFTPEFRIYLGKKGFGSGFYVAPFYRYASFKTNTLKVNFTGENGPKSLNLAGNLNTNTAGILFGAQWGVGRHLAIDWWIAGPHYGSGKGLFTGVSNKPLTQMEQDELARQMNNIDVPLLDKTVHIDANGGTMNLSGPWAGVRAGLSLGIKF